MRFLLLIITIFSFAYARDGVKNITLHTMDVSEVSQKVDKRLMNISLSKLKKTSDYKHHIQNMSRLQQDIKSIISTQYELQSIDKELQAAIKSYDEAEKRYTKKMSEIYDAHKQTSRVLYYLVHYPLEEDYLGKLKNTLVDKYAIIKFEQNTEIQESSKGVVKYNNVVSTTKDFGQMQMETLKDITFRDKNLNFKIIKVTQHPFVKTKETTYSKATTKEIDKFKESKNIGVLELNDFDLVNAIYLPKMMLTYEEIEKIMKPLRLNININSQTKKLTKSSQTIIQTIKKIEQQHDKYIASLNKRSSVINALTFKQEQQKDILATKLQEAKKISNYYSIELNLDDLQKLIIVTPKLYSAYVELGEEKDFVKRKVNSYLKKLSITELAQSETLSNYVDLKTQNITKSKLVEYESIHFFPFVQGNEMAMLVFGVIKLEDKIDESDYISRDLKYSSYTFVPVNKANKTLFVATTEVTLGSVKEFVETHRVNKYFDRYCVQDSLLPEDAKDFKNISSEYYEYPAVCFKPQRVAEFVEWLGKKLGKRLSFATPDEWSYVASNASSSEYCWGNATLDELNEDGLKPANIYYEDQQDTTIEKVKSFKKSRLGIYDMCGNVHELVKDGDVYMIEGNSYISFVEPSNAPALEYEESLNPMIGLRAFYRLEK